MKNVLIISSSPRRGGNSDTLCDQFLRGAADVGHQAEKIFLADHKIGYCTGCGVCNTTHRCTQKDDMSPILDKMLAADVIVFGSPIYFYTMCGQLKTFIDRCCARYTELSNKQFYYILTAADSSQLSVDRAVVEFAGFLDCLTAPKHCGTIRGVDAWQKGEINDKPAMDEAYQMGKMI